SLKDFRRSLTRIASPLMMSFPPLGCRECRAADPGTGSGAVDGDVAVGGAAPHLDGLLGLLGPGGVLQPVADVPVPGVQFQPGGGALGDADLQVARGGAEDYRPADPLAEAEAAVGRLRVDTSAGPLDADVAVRGAHPHVAGDRV